ncbi:MAG: hypothetical protein GY861_28660 [bacterium]|nr:hypothetical protein [bacterium]
MTINSENIKSSGGDINIVEGGSITTTRENTAINSLDDKLKSVVPNDKDREEILRSAEKISEMSKEGNVNQSKIIAILEKIKVLAPKAVKVVIDTLKLVGIGIAVDQYISN